MHDIYPQDATMIYQRTSAGNNLLHHPHNGLSVDVAVTLMQIDGRTDHEKLARRNPRFDLNSILRDLSLAGLIESTPTEAAPPPAAQPVSARASSPTPAPTQAAPNGFMEVGKAAAKLLSHALGPQADRLALALERSQSPVLLAYQLELARDELKRFRKDATLAELDELVGAVLVH
jgi:hypothetical protein